MKRLSVDEFSDSESGQPDNYKGVENCLLMRGGEHNFKWNDGSCQNRFTFIFEKDLEV